MKDKYDEAIAHLEANPGHIYETWNKPWQMTAGCLFQFTGPSDKDGGCGCLTQVAAGCRPAPTDELTLAIRADTRIPRHADYITVAHLPVFAEWQRKIDALGVRGV